MGAPRTPSAAETVFSPSTPRKTSATRKGKLQESAADRPSTPSEAKVPSKALSKARSLGETLRETYSVEQMKTIEQMKQRQLAVLLLSKQAPQCCNKGVALMLGRDKTRSKRPGSSGSFGGAPRFSKAVYEGSADHYAQSTIYKGLLGPGMYDVTCSRSGQYLDMGQPEGRPTTAPASGFGMKAKRWLGPTRYERDGKNAELMRVDPQCMRTGQPLSAQQQGTAVSLRAGTRGITLYDGRASLKHSAYGRGSYGPGGYDVRVDRRGNTTKARSCDGASFGTGPRFPPGPMDAKKDGAGAIGALLAPADAGMTAFGKQSLSTYRSQTGFAFARGTSHSYAKVHVPQDFMQEVMPAKDTVAPATGPAKITYPMRGCASKDTYGKAQSGA